MGILIKIEQTGNDECRYKFPQILLAIVTLKEIDFVKAPRDVSLVLWQIRLVSEFIWFHGMTKFHKLDRSSTIWNNSFAVNVLTRIYSGTLKHSRSCSWNCCLAVNCLNESQSESVCMCNRCLSTTLRYGKLLPSSKVPIFCKPVKFLIIFANLNEILYSLFIVVYTNPLQHRSRTLMRLYLHNSTVVI